jgi:hypothetical protein
MPKLDPRTATCFSALAAWVYDRTSDYEVAGIVDELELIARAAAREKKGEAGLEISKYLTYVYATHVPPSAQPIRDEDIRIEHFRGDGRKQMVIATHEPTKMSARYESLISRDDAELHARAELRARVKQHLREQEGA